MLVSFATGRSFGASPLLAGLASWMLVAMACAPLAAQAPDRKPPAAKPAPRAAEGIEQERPAFFVHAEADRKSLEYWDGEQLKITVRCEVEAYIYVLYTQADQKSYIVFPNSGQPENGIAAKAAVQIPGERDAFRWTVSEPFGKEQLKVIACKQRIEALEKPEVRRGNVTGLSSEEIKKTIAEIRAKIPPKDWSEVSLEITTHKGLNPKSPYAGKRYGAFFAVPFQHASILATKAGFEPSAGNLGLVTILDTMLLRRALTGSEGLTARVFPIPESHKRIEQTSVTRESMKQAITGWLAEVTKPEDTVIIYYSGHGAAIEDPSSPGGKLTYLVPSDFVDLQTLLVLRRMNSEGVLAPEQKAQLEEMEGWLRDEKIVLDPAALKSESKETRRAAVQAFNAAEAVFIKRSCITDSEFAHWLQKLPNRRIIVILHACHSGGFGPDLGGAAPTKGAPLKAMELPVSPPVAFEFLQPQLVRLKDIGHASVAFIAAAQANQTAKAPHFSVAGPDMQRLPASLVAREVFDETKRNLDLKDDLPDDVDLVSIFTFHLANVLLKTNAAMDVDKAAAECAAEMEQYFGSELFRAKIKADNERRAKLGQEPWDLKTFPHQPLWFDNNRPKALLKR